MSPHLYRGTRGLEHVPWFAAPAPDDLPGFARIRHAGDVNGDGYADFLVSLAVPSAASMPPTSTTVGWRDLVCAVEPWGGSRSFGYYSVAGAGDVNGDGYGDIVVGSLVGGHVRIYLGSAAGLESEPVVDLLDSGTYYGSHVASAGDIDGDGYGDVIVGAAHLGGSRGCAYVYLGSADGTSGDARVLEADEWHFGFAADGGDIDGDGYSEAVVAASNSGNVYVFRGGPGARGLAEPPDVWTTPGASAWPLAVVGDVNGDGYADVAAGGLLEDAAYLYYGGPTGLGALPEVLGYEGAPWFGYSVGSGAGG